MARKDGATFTPSERLPICQTFVRQIGRLQTGNTKGSRRPEPLPICQTLVRQTGRGQTGNTKGAAPRRENAKAWKGP